MASSDDRWRVRLLAACVFVASGYRRSRAAELKELRGLLLPSSQGGRVNWR